MCTRRFSLSGSVALLTNKPGGSQLLVSSGNKENNNTNSAPAAPTMANFGSQILTRLGGSQLLRPALPVGGAKPAGGLPAPASGTATTGIEIIARCAKDQSRPCLSTTATAVHHDGNDYDFDAVYDESSSDAALLQRSLAPLLDALLKGANVSVYVNNGEKGNVLTGSDTDDMDEAGGLVSP